MAYKLLKTCMLTSQVDASALMNNFPVPIKFVAAALLSGILVLVGIYNYRDRAAWIVSTDGIFWAESEGSLKASIVDPTGPGALAGIRSGDQLASINNQAISDLGRYYDLLDRLQPGESVAYILASDSGTRSVAVKIGSKSSLTAKDRLRALLAFLHLGIGIFILIRGDRSSRAFHFYLICLAAFVVYLYSWTTRLGALDWWVYALSVLAFLLLPALFAHFCLRFPVDTAAGRRLTPFSYLPALLLVVTQLLWWTGHLAPLGLPRNERSSSILDQIQLIYFVVGFFICSALLLKRRIEAKDWTIRQQMKWISYGTLSGIVPFSLIYVLPVLLGAHASFAMESSMLFLGLIPLSVGYALIHYRLIDVEAIARRSAAYFIASSLLLALYLLFVILLNTVLQWAAPQVDFFAICFIVLVIALLFAPLRNAIQTRLDRLFYRDQFEDRETLLRFSQTLSSQISLVPLARSILDRISKTFQIDKAAIFLTDQKHGHFFRTVDVLGGNMPSANGLFRENELVGKEDPENPIGDKNETGHLRPAGPALSSMGLHYLQDLRIRGKHVGMIALGNLPKGRRFSTEDLELLDALSGYAAMALENAKLYSSIKTKAQELERLKAYTENIIESINVAVLALNPGGRITSCNRAFEDLYELTREHIIGAPVEQLLPRDVITCIQRAAGIQNAGGIQNWDLSSPANIFKLSFENSVGKRLIVNLSLIPLQDLFDGNSGSLIVMDDITEKIYLEDQLLQAEKLSSIGLLAAGIAHEVNTPIAGISSYTQMLLKDMPDSDRRKHILEKIEKQTFRAAEIVNGLLNFSRLSGSEFKDLDINQLIGDSLALLGHQMQTNHIRVESQLDLSLPPVYGNMGKLQQVFINLFLNARDAMPSGGELAIQTGMTESMVIVDISDTGVGIPEENVRRIFDPFFTTKSIGKGTGLGLAVTYGIIQEHGGGIFVNSTTGRGTHFRVKLPIRLH
jgi:two-component system, NtrC family, sensor kinase